MKGNVQLAIQIVEGNSTKGDDISIISLNCGGKYSFMTITIGDNFFKFNDFGGKCGLG